MHLDFGVIAAVYAPVATTTFHQELKPARYMFRTNCSHNRDIYISQGEKIELGRVTNSVCTKDYQRIEFYNPYVSKVHAVIRADEKGVFLVDVGTNDNGSKHGTYINGVKLIPKTRAYLKNGDVVSLANPRNLPSIQLTLIG